MNRTGTHKDFRRHLELTARQRQVIELMARGYTNGQIGHSLGISLDGAKWHVSEIIGKFDVASREEAVSCWRAYQRPSARLARALRSLAPGGMMRWAAGGATVAGAVAVAAVAIAIASGDSTTSGSPETAEVVLNPTPVSPPTATPTSTSTSAPEEDDMPIRVVFLRDGEVAAVQRTVPATPAAGQAALEALFAGPAAAETAAGLSSAVSPDTRVLDLTIADGIATVDLSAAFLMDGGGAPGQEPFAQVVSTLTQFSTVEAVIFQVEGEAVEAPGDDGPLSRAVTPVDFEAVTPAIFVESPAHGALVSVPLRVTGTANTFEAEFIIEVLGSDGEVVAEMPVMATSGSGLRGTFDVTVPLEADPGGGLTIVAFAISAEDGSRMHIVEVPVSTGE